MQPFLQIRTDKFPIQQGEEQLLCNPGTYGKSFAEYLQTRLVDKGYNAPFVCCEDWGWWVEVRLPEKSIGILCYREHDQDGDCGFVCSPSPQTSRVWSWRRLKNIDIGSQLEKLVVDLQRIFEEDPQIDFLGQSDDFPFV